MEILKSMLVGKRLIIALGVLLTVAAAPMGILLMNQFMDTEATVSDALRMDAQSYATEWGISLNEAIRRLQLQSEIGKLGAKLEKNEAGTYAGHWIKHGTDADDFGVVARFTRDGEQTLQRYGQHVANGPLSGMVEVRGADKTLVELKEARNRTIKSLGPLGIPVESSINVKENKAEVYVVDKSGLESVMRGANVELSDKVRLVKVGELSKKTTDIYGGLGITSCTIGFPVENSNGTRGITTAGHCSESQSYRGTTLPMQAKRFMEEHDIQWHTAPGLTVTSLFVNGEDDDGQTIRSLTGAIYYEDQDIGMYLCKYGKESGYDCGYIEHLHFRPSYPDSECRPGPTCSFTDDWVRVSHSVVGGDSGGPIFLGGKAIGTVAFAFNDDAIYMPIDHLETFQDLSLLTH